jgi:hypothetical protein
MIEGLENCIQVWRMEEKLQATFATVNKNLNDPLYDGYQAKPVFQFEIISF